MCAERAGQAPDHLQEGAKRGRGGEGESGGGGGSSSSSSSSSRSSSKHQAPSVGGRARRGAAVPAAVDDGGGLMGDGGWGCACLAEAVPASVPEGACGACS